MPQELALATSLIFPSVLFFRSLILLRRLLRTTPHIPTDYVWSVAYVVVGTMAATWLAKSATSLWTEASRRALAELTMTQGLYVFIALLTVLEVKGALMGFAGATGSAATRVSKLLTRKLRK